MRYIEKVGFLTWLVKVIPWFVDWRGSRGLGTHCGHGKKRRKRKKKRRRRFRRVSSFLFYEGRRRLRLKEGFFCSKEKKRPFFFRSRFFAAWEREASLPADPNWEGRRKLFCPENFSPLISDHVKLTNFKVKQTEHFVLLCHCPKIENSSSEYRKKRAYIHLSSFVHGQV